MVSADHLPKKLQDIIDTFIEQAEIADEYNLEYVPIEYATQLLEELSKYPEYTSLTKELYITLTQDNR